MTLFLCLLASIPQARAQDITTGLIGHWKLDETSGILADSSGNGNDGTQGGGIGYAATGKIGTAVTFDGSNDYVDVGNVIDFVNTNDYTITAWINIDDFSDDSAIIAKSDVSENFVWRVENDGSLDFRDFVSDPDRENRTAAGLISPGTWYHVAVSYSASDGKGKQYVNGAYVLNAQDDDTMLTASNGGSVIIGYRLSTSNDPFDGNLDDVRIYNRALTAADIKELYRSWPGNIHYNTEFRTAQYHDGYSWIAMGREGVPTDGLVGHWKLDEAGGNLIDSVGGFDAVPAGGPGYSSAGMTGTAIDFIDDAYAIVADAPSLRPGDGDFAFSFWMKTPGYVNQGSGSNRIIVKNAGSPDDLGYVVNIDSSHKLLFRIGTGSSNTAITNVGTDLSDNEWHHVVVMRENGIIKNYMDSVKYGNEKTEPVAITNTDNLHFSDDVTNRDYIGLLDDIRYYNRALTATEVAALYDYGLRDDGLAAHLRLDESGGTYVNDSTGSLVGFASGGATLGVAGQIAQGAEFDGVNGMIDAGDITDLVDVVNGPWTVTGWALTDVMGQDFAPAFGFYDSADYDDKIVIGMDGTDIKIISDGNTPGDGSALTQGAWHHMAMVWDGADFYAYLDGAFDYAVTPTGAGWQSANTLRLAREHRPQDDFWDGKIDDVRVYNRRLSDNEIATIHAHGLAGRAAPHCANPSRPEGALAYNTDADVMQFCNGSDWIAMGPVPGAGGGGCGGPAGVAGDIGFNTSVEVMQYCDGTDWREIGGRGEVSVDAASTAACDDSATPCTGGDTLTYAHTVGNGKNRLLVVGVAVADGTCGSSDPDAVTSVTYNGDALTQIASHINTDATCAQASRLEQWYLVNPDSGTHNVEVTVAPATGDSIISHATSFFGAHQSSPVRNHNAADGYNTTATVTVASAPGDLVMDTVCSGSGVGSADVSQTELATLNVSGTSGCFNIGASVKPGAASVDMDWTVGNDVWVDFATSIRPVK